MDKTRFLTIFPTFENLAVVRQTLPTVIAETRRSDAKLIVHDSSVRGRGEKWAYLQELAAAEDFVLLLSTNLSMAHVRNMCLQLGQELYAPDFVCMLEDDHGVKEGFVAAMVAAMDRYYGRVSPNGLRYGLFSGCGTHHYGERGHLPDGNSYPGSECVPEWLGGTNSCCRCAPTAHWNNVLRGYDTDEYLISTFQTRNLKLRNYHKGFSALIVQDGALMFDVEMQGRGFSAPEPVRRWDEHYAASDPRSRYLGESAA